MKKIITLITVISLCISCDKNKETSVTEETTTDSTIVVDSMAVPTESVEDVFASSEMQELKEQYENTTFDELNVSNIVGAKLVEKNNDDYALPVLELDNDACSNTSQLKIKDLNSGSNYEIYQVISNDQATLAALGFNGSIGNKETLIIKDYVRYTKINCSGTDKKYGIGLRCFIHIRTKNYDGGANLPYLAASVQMDKTNAEFKLVSLGFGINGTEFSNIKSAGSFNVENFVDIEKVFDNVLKFLNNENNMVIDPVVLP